MTRPTMLDGALALAQNGLPVLGLWPESKRPRLMGAYKTATTDLFAVAEHWRRYRRDNVGVRPPEGMVVLDIDPRNGGDRDFKRLLLKHGPLPETWTARTGSGGSHYWFLVGEIPLRSALATGIDLKSGRNGFVVVPPSIHPDGGQYLWDIPPSRRHPQPALAPDWLMKQAMPPADPVRWTHPASGINGHGRYTCQCLCARIAAAREGRRHITFYGAVKDAHRQGDLPAYAADLGAAALAVGLDPNEIASTIRSVGRGGSG